VDLPAAGPAPPGRRRLRRPVPPLKGRTVDRLDHERPPQLQGLRAAAPAQRSPLELGIHQSHDEAAYPQRPAPRLVQKDCGHELSPAACRRPAGSPCLRHATGSQPATKVINVGNPCTARWFSPRASFI
jgi:hypothetical protein